MSREIKYDKLVRDKIPQIIEDTGKEYRIHIADEQEYLDCLFAKVQEELEEFQEDPSTEEMADIFEVLEAFIAFYSLDKQRIKNIKQEKKDKRGAFEDRIILEKVIESEQES